MTFYPVIIPTLNRYSHFKRCVESLARNTYADKTELVIGLDFPPNDRYVEGYKKIKEYLPTITGFEKVTIFERSHNYGAERNINALSEYAYNNYDAQILTEDDNEFSPCFLEYMNLMLNHYKDDSRVVTVSAYTPSSYSEKSSNSILFSLESNGWGYGTWRYKAGTSEERRAVAVNVLKTLQQSWKSFWMYPACFRMLIKMSSQGKTWGDVIRTQYNIVNGTFQVRPVISLVRNWGNDGSGENCRVDDSIVQQPISEALTFEAPKRWEPYCSESVKRATFRLTWPKNPILFAGKMVITVFLYLKYRITH